MGNHYGTSPHNVWSAMPWNKNTKTKCCTMQIARQCNCKLQLHTSGLNAKTQPLSASSPNPNANTNQINLSLLISHHSKHIHKAQSCFYLPRFSTCSFFDFWNWLGIVPVSMLSTAINSQQTTLWSNICYITNDPRTNCNPLSYWFTHIGSTLAILLDFPTVWEFLSALPFQNIVALLQLGLMSPSRTPHTTKPQEAKPWRRLATWLMQSAYEKEGWQWW